MKTYAEAFAQLPPGAKPSCSFGSPGIGGYSEFWRTPDGARYEISNGRWDAVEPTWTFHKLDLGAADAALWSELEGA